MKGQKCEYCGELALGGVKITYPNAPESDVMYLHATCYQVVLELFELSRGRSVG